MQSAPWWAYTTKDGRRVYYGEDASNMRDNTQRAIATRFYWRRASREARLTRIKRVPYGSGQLWYLRLLVCKVSARSFADYRNHSGTTHPTYEAACRARGLLSEDSEARDVLEDAISNPDVDTLELRSLFVGLTLEGFPMGELITDAAIFTKLVGTPVATAAARDACIADLDERLQLMSSSMARYFPPEYCPTEDQSDEVARERRIYADRSVQQRLAQSADLRLDGLPGPPEQSRIVVWGLTGVLPTYQHGLPANAALRELEIQQMPFRQPRDVNVAYLQGDGGAGKSRTVKRLLAELRARGQIALVSAASNLAATNFERGWSLHALAKLPIDADNDGNITIKLKPAGNLTLERLALFKAAALIVIDEGPALKCEVLEAFIQMLEEHRCQVRLLIVGDVQQIPPIAGNSREETVEASLVSNPTYAEATKFLLSKQYRAASDEPWAAAVRALGDGSAPAVEGHPFNDDAAGKRAVAMPLVPDEQLFTAGRETEAIEWLFGRTDSGALDVQSGFKAVLCARNLTKNVWNQRVSDMLAAETGADAGVTYTAYHEAVVNGADADELGLSHEDLDVFDNIDPTAPVKELTLRIGDVCLLAKNVDKVAGLVKNRRVVVVALYRNAARVKLERDGSPPTYHVISRCRFNMMVKGKGFGVMRKQLPFVLAYALTYNKSQGQTMDRILVDATIPAFEHGHSYVGASRVHSRAEYGAYVDGACLTRHAGKRCLVIASIAYSELLDTLVGMRRHAMQF